MKILLFAASFPPPGGGGSVEYLYHIVSNLPPGSVVIQTADHDPQNAKEFDRALQQRVIRCRFIPHVLEKYYIGRNPLRILHRKLRHLRGYLLWPLIGFALIVRERPDVIMIGEQNFAAVAAWLAQWLLRIPYLHFAYAEEITTLNKRPLRRHLHLALLRKAQAVVTVCDYTRDLLIKAGVTPERITKILPAVGKQKKAAHSPAQIAMVRQKYRLKDCHRVLLTVGALVRRKGHTTVLEALPLVNARLSHVRYIIAGGGPFENTLKQQVQDMGLASQVIFAGRVDDTELACLYEICEVFVLAHRQLPDSLDTEGCPTVFLEAGARGRPVIGGNAGGVADAIRNGITGFIVDGTNKTAIAENICLLLENRDLAEKMGKAGEDYVSTLTPERNTAKVWQLSKELAANPLDSSCL